LPSVALGKEGSTYSASAKPSLSSTFLGHSAKWFAECQRTLGKEKQLLRRRLTETASLPSVPCDTRQRRLLCRVFPNILGKEFTSLPSVYYLHSAKEPPDGSPCQVLCRVLSMALGKACFFTECQSHYTRQRTYTGARSWFFVECYGPDTRQSTTLPSVTLGKVTSTYLFYLFSLFHPKKQKIFTDITYIHHRSSQTYIANTNSINTNSDISIQHKLRGSQHKQY
jgi:hypothetical protein